MHMWITTRICGFQNISYNSYSIVYGSIIECSDYNQPQCFPFIDLFVAAISALTATKRFQCILFIN